MGCCGIWELGELRLEADPRTNPVPISDLDLRSLVRGSLVRGLEALKAGWLANLWKSNIDDGFSPSLRRLHILPLLKLCRNKLSKKICLIQGMVMSNVVAGSVSLFTPLNHYSLS